MIICDICGSKTDCDERVDLYAHYTTRSFAKVSVHMCVSCRTTLDRKKKEAEADFYNTRVKK